MLSSFRISALTLTLTTGLITAGCGANPSMLPTGPSIGSSSSGALMSDVVASTSEAAAPEAKGGHGRVDADHGRQDDKNKEGDKGKEGDKAKGVEANGRITSIDVAARTLLVGTHSVSVPDTATIRHGSTTVAFAVLKVGDHVQVKGTLNATAVLVASEVKVEQGGKEDDAEDEDDDDAEDGDLNKVELSGAVSALTGGCLTALKFTVQTKQVATTATTTFRGITCAAIANGTVVEVKGTRLADGSVAASRVSLED